MKNLNDLIELMEEKGISPDYLIKHIEKITLDDGTADFWRANQELLDFTEDWNFDYSDMGYTDEIQF